MNKTSISCFYPASMSFHFWLKYCPPSKLRGTYSLFRNSGSHILSSWYDISVGPGLLPEECIPLIMVIQNPPDFSKLQERKCSRGIDFLCIECFGCSLPVNSSAIPYSCSQFNWYYSSSLNSKIKFQQLEASL